MLKIIALLFTFSLPLLAEVSTTFTDVTREAGIDFHHAGTQPKRTSLLPEDMGSGAAFADIDNDGDLDVYIVNIPGPFGVTHRSPARNALYRNNGDGTFTDITKTAGVGDTGYGMGCVFADYNGDGHLDFYVTNYGPNVLYRNNGDSTFTDVTDVAFPNAVGALSARTPLWSTGAAFADTDADGDLELYVCNYVTYDLAKLEEMKAESLQSGKPVPSALNPHVFEPQDNVFYRNNGDGTFTDVTAEAGVAAAGGRSMQAVFSDFDGDTALDLYVANDTTVNHAYRNNGDGTFTDVSDDSWAADFRGSMGVTTGDYDNDGDTDIFMSHWVDEENALYRNLLKEGIENVEDGSTQKDVHAQKPLSNALRKTRIRFVDESYSAMLAEVSIKQIGWGTSLFDYDNDGDLDIFVANGSTFQELHRPEVLIAQQDALFRNNGDETFTDVSAEAGIAQLPHRVGRGTTFGDYDNDGDVDIFIVNNHAPPTLLRNEAAGMNWLHVKLHGTGANWNAIGAKIRLKTANAVQMREICAGESYLSSNSYLAEFGLGAATKIEWLEVTWPNGKTQRMPDKLTVNQRIDIHQKPEQDLQD